MSGQVRYDNCRTLEDHFIYFLDCQLATVEELGMLSKPPKGRLNRHRGIARKMIETARAYKIDISSVSRIVQFESEEKA